MKFGLTTVLFIIALTVATSVEAGKPVYSGGRDRAAIRGYDPVAYFTQNEAVKGSKEFTVSYNGATWMFSSAEHKALFEADPEKYAPQFGGYCAYAVSQNTTASIKPKYFTIHEGKLYLNYSKPVHKRWSSNKADLIKQAETHWPNILKD